MVEQVFEKQLNGKVTLMKLSLANGVLGDKGTLSFFGKSHFENVEHCILTEEKLLSEVDSKFDFDFGVLAQIKVLELHKKILTKKELKSLLVAFARIPS